MRSALVTPSAFEQIFPGGGRFPNAGFDSPMGRLIPRPEIIEAVLEWVDPQARDEVLARNAAFQQEILPDRHEAISKGHPGLDKWGIYRRLHAQWCLYVVGSPQGDPYSNRDTYDLLGWFPGKKATIRKLSPKEEQETSQIFRRRLGTTKAVEGARAFHQRLQRQPQGIQETRTVCRYCRKFFTRSILGKSSDVCKTSDCRKKAEADKKRKQYQETFL